MYWKKRIIDYSKWRIRFAFLPRECIDDTIAWLERIEERQVISSPYSSSGYIEYRRIEHRPHYIYGVQPLTSPKPNPPKGPKQ